MLTQLDHLPEGLLDLPAARLHEKLAGPTLIHLPGRRPEPLFVSVLLHGNEDTGWEAIRLLLQHHQGRELPRALSLFIGNIGAAREGVRRLEGEIDYNRIWKGEGGAEQAMAQQILAQMAGRRPFASIDIHNNTGLNPYYGCINRLDQRFLHLATLFSRTVVYFIRPDAVQSMAFSELCPAVTVECGRVGDAHGNAHAFQFVDAVLHLDHFPDHPLAQHDYELFHTVATVKIPEELEFAFSDGGEGDGARALTFARDLDHLNFRELPAGTPLARVNDAGVMLQAWSEEGEDLAGRYFHNDGRQLTLRSAVMPSMLTLNERVIRQDCLCYLMERLPPLGETAG